MWVPVSTQVPSWLVLVLLISLISLAICVCCVYVVSRANLVVLYYVQSFSGCLSED